jgi:hypothetical protein
MLLGPVDCDPANSLSERAIMAEHRARSKARFTPEEVRELMELLRGVHQ